MTRETLAEIELHRQYFRSLRPKRRLIQFDPQIHSTAGHGGLGDNGLLINYGRSTLEPTTIASCHLQNLSVEDLNLPSSPCKAKAVASSSIATLDHHIMRQNMGSSSAIAAAAASKGADHTDDHGGCASISIQSASSYQSSVVTGGCSIRSAYEEKRLRAHEQRKRQQRIQKLEMAA